MGGEQAGMGWASDWQSGTCHHMHTEAHVAGCISWRPTLQHPPTVTHLPALAAS